MIIMACGRSAGLLVSAWDLVNGLVLKVAGVTCTTSNRARFCRAITGPPRAASRFTFPNSIQIIANESGSARVYSGLRGASAGGAGGGALGGFLPALYPSKASCALPRNLLGSCLIISCAAFSASSRRFCFLALSLAAFCWPAWPGRRATLQVFGSTLQLTAGRLATSQFFGSTSQVTTGEILIGSTMAISQR